MEVSQTIAVVVYKAKGRRRVGRQVARTTFVGKPDVEFSDTYLFFDITTWERKVYPQKGQPPLGPQFPAELMTLDELRSGGGGHQ